MKFIKLTTLAISVFLLFSSCSKDDDENSNPTAGSTKDYTPLEIGNYWIYQRFNIDSLGNASATNMYDSTYIEKDTIIGGDTYFKKVSPNTSGSQPEISFIKDSLSYLVNSKGIILFSSQDFTTTLSEYIIPGPNNDTIAVITRKMTDKDLTVFVPAGAFITSNAKEIYSMGPSWSFAGNPRFRNHRYSPNIGLVTETLPFYVSTPTYVERRLVRYMLF